MADNDKSFKVVTMKKHHDSSDDSDSSAENVKTNLTSLRTLMRPQSDVARSKPFFPNITPPNAMASQEHARPRPDSSRSLQLTDSSSLSGSIARFRGEFDDMKTKMQIFGESLNLCKCIAVDFDTKVSQLEKRLEGLERRQRIRKSESNYSYIIKKNKRLSSKTLDEAKKLQMCGTEDEMREVAGRICRNYLHGAWKSIEASELNFRRISGGLSNFLYYVALPDDLSKAKYRDSPAEDDVQQYSSTAIHNKCYPSEEPKKVLLRIYGQVHGERAMDAIVTESVIFTLLSERRLGPKLHGVFSGGRIEEYIPARPLLTRELAEPALSMKIAEKMAAIHSMDIPLSKEPNWLWKTMGKWLKTVKEERLARSVDDKNEADIIKRLKNVDFDKELEWLKKFLATVDSPVVFCHNDMQEGNILMLEDTHDEDSPYRLSSSYQEDSPRKTFDPTSFEESTVDSESSHISDLGEPKLVLIDFEYCAYNYRGFDIANHFQEWVYDYTNPDPPNYFENQENAPTLEQKEIFIREYLKHYNANDGRDASATIDEVNHLLNEVDAFALASHLFWCLWSVVNASKSQIPFGYWEYAISRLDTYIRLKQEVVKKDKFGPQKRKICEVDI